MHRTRAQVRQSGALVSAAMAVIYFLIGLGVLDIGGSTSGETVDIAVFGFSAGSAFLVLALMLLFTDRRWVWVLALSSRCGKTSSVARRSRRPPPFEVSGHRAADAPAAAGRRARLPAWKSPAARSRGR